MFQATIDLIDIEGTNTLRAILEDFNVLVNRYPIGQPQHLVDVLSDPEDKAPILVINGHGCEQGFLLPSLTPDLEIKQPFNNVLTATQVRQNFRLRSGLVILSLACKTGSKEMAEAWLEVGAKAYIAPKEYPAASEALFFATCFFRELLTQGKSIHQALDCATDNEGDTDMFKLYT